jgi:hypothetical protein
VDDWPHPWSRLVDLADDAELTADELRAYLYAEIERRKAAPADAKSANRRGQVQ